MATNYIYARVFINIPFPATVIGSIAAEQAADKAVMEARKKLNEIGVDWVHEYFWPGDDLHVFLRTETLEELTRFQEMGTISQLEGSRRTYRGGSVDELFQQKYNKETIK